MNAGEVEPRRSPLGYRNFRLLLAAMITDTLGNAVMRVVLPFAVFAVLGVDGDSPARELAHAAVAVAWVAAAQIAGLGLVTVFGGAIADRWPRSLVLVWSNIAALLIDGALAWALLTGRATVPLIVALSFAAGGGAAVSHSASLALIRDTVPTGLLQTANAVASMGRSVVRIGSYLVAGVIAATLDPALGVAINAATFGVVAILFAKIQLPRRIRPSSKFIDDLREGFITFWDLDWARSTVLVFTVINACFSAALLVLGPLVAIRTLGEAAWGWVLGAESIGLIIVSAVLSRSRHEATLWRGMVGVILSGPFLVSMAVPCPHAWLVVSLGAVSGMGIGYFDVAWNLALQRHVPEDRLARVYSVDLLGSTMAQPIGQVTAGQLVGVIGISASLLGFAAVMTVFAVMSLFIPSIRRLDG